jgi:hypothetical protein
LHGGTIEVRGEGIGQGSTFIVQLRRVSAPHEASPAQDRQSSRAGEVPPRADRRR